MTETDVSSTPYGAYKTGHRADHPAVVARRAGLHLHPDVGRIGLAALSLPIATTNRVFMDPAKGGPDILNQNDTSGCEGHANASGGTLLLAKRGLSKGLISPTALYVGALLIDRTATPDGTLSSVTDAGTMPSSISTAWGMFGALLAKDDPQFPAMSATLYASPGDSNSPIVLPPIEKLYADSPYRFGGAYFITTQGATRLLQALSVLAVGLPISDAIPASGNDFQGYHGGIVGALSGPVDHANLIVDYEWQGSAVQWAAFVSGLQAGTLDTAMATLLIFHCVNSWGIPWGEADKVSGMPGGMYRANVSYFNQAEDLCVLDLSAA